MKDLLDKLRTNFLEKLPPRISETLKESIEQSERNEFTLSLQSLSESVFLLLKDEYYTPSGLVWINGLSVVEMIRELRKVGKDLGKSETDAILRIQEKAKLKEIDSVVLESCFQGATEILESYLREKGNMVKKKTEVTDRKSPGSYILEELEELLLESDTYERIQTHFPKIEEIYHDFPYDKNTRKIYYQFLSLVDTERAKKEILSYLESGDVTIHLGAVCISLLSEMGFLYDAKKKLSWYEEEYSGEVDGKYAKLSVFLHAYLKDGREADRQRVESVSDIVAQNKEPYYIYTSNCYHLFSNREDAIRKKYEGLYLYKENIFWEKCLKRSEEDLEQKELKKQEEEKKREIKKSEVINEPTQKKLELTKEPLVISSIKPQNYDTVENLSKSDSNNKLNKNDNYGIVVIVVILLALIGNILKDKNSNNEIDKLSSSSQNRTELIQFDAKELYVYCAACHGEDGNGDGPAAAALNPEPRNFKSPDSHWKNGKTKTGIIKTLKEGIAPGMASYSYMKDEEVEALADYVLNLGN